MGYGFAGAGRGVRFVPMSSNTNVLSTAVAEASGELKQASRAVSAGATTEEAFADIVGDGPRNVVWEMQEAQRRQRNPSHFLLQFGSETQRWNISASGNIIVPVVDDYVSGRGFARSAPKDETATRKARDGMARYPKKLDELAGMGSKIQQSLKMPPAVAPYVVQSLSPHAFVLQIAPVLVTLGVLAFLKLDQKASRN